MLQRRLLIGGPGSFIDANPVAHDMTMVAYLTRLANKVINEDTAFDWDTARVLDTSYATWTIGDATKLYCVRAGWYFVGGDFTTLGTFYGGADNADWLAGVGKNGVALANTVILERHYHSSGASADLMSIGAPVYLTSSDYLQVYFQNAGGTTLLVESNPSDGLPSGYLTDSGPGTMSPHLYLIAMNGSAPS